MSQQKNVNVDYLQNDDSMELVVAFLVDITSQLNELAPGNTVCHLMAAGRSFERCLEIFKSDITGPHLHFPTLLPQTDSHHHHHHHLPFLEKLAQNFRECSEGFKC